MSRPFIVLYEVQEPHRTSHCIYSFTHSHTLMVAIYTVAIAALGLN